MPYIAATTSIPPRTCDAQVGVTENQQMLKEDEVLQWAPCIRNHYPYNTILINSIN